MSRTTRSPLQSNLLCISDDAAARKQTRQVRGQAPPNCLTMKTGMRVDIVVGGSKSHRVRMWKKLAKRRASKRNRQESHATA